MAFLPMLSQWSMQVINTTLFGISNRHIVVTYQHLASTTPPPTNIAPPITKPSHPPSTPSTNSTPSH